MTFTPKDVKLYAEEIVRICRAQTDPSKAVLDLLKDAIERGIIHAYSAGNELKRRKRRKKPGR